jgi:hypothetical protein
MCVEGMMIDLFVPIVGMVKKISIMPSKITLVQKNSRFHSPLGGWFEDISLPFIPYIEQVNFQS